MPFEHLFSPLTIRSKTIKNRIFSTGHQTRMIEGGVPTEQMVAYHEARAAGGAGLIITEAARVHDTALSAAPAIDASTDACIPGYQKIADAVHRHGGLVFGQASHSGRANDRLRNGMRDVPYSASAVPDERFHNMPREMSLELIEEVVEAYGTGAARLIKGGLDGVETTASHGVLAAQFMNPRSNRRTDKYGGSLENRVRFQIDVIKSIRHHIGEDYPLGLRISVDEMEHGGLEPSEAQDICRLLSAVPELDYFNVIAGSMSGLAGSVHVVPPMMVETGYTAPLAALLKEVTDKPVFVAGRINQPQLAEQILNAGQADMCGMTRAMIADPDMAMKAEQGRLDDIRACIGCNQACIGHFHTGNPISCIQHPETGRELEFVDKGRAEQSKRVLVIGGGPGGMKAALTAAERGHQVTLCEASGRLGGQALLAQLLPGRAEFGGLITNLEHELSQTAVDVRRNTPVTLDLVRELAPEAVILATGASPYLPPVEGQEDAHMVDAWSVLKGEANVGSDVLIADWRCDWVGIGLAEKLARDGCRVRLAVTGICAGQNLQSYLRDHWVGTIHKLGVEIIPYARLFGADSETVYLQHTASGEPILCEGVETTVLALGHQSEISLESELRAAGYELHLAGDCLSPRSAEEAVYEGMIAGLAV